MDTCIEKIIDGYNNDGYIYCINTGSFIESNEIVKIGKTVMKINENKTLSALLDRYSTYFPDCKIYKCIRVSNCHSAEKTIFKMLSELGYKKEHFYFDKMKIDNVFNEIKMMYPDINTVIINSEINQVSHINKKLRHYFKNN